MAVAGDGSIDWNVHGAYCFATVRRVAETDTGIYEALVAGDVRQATHVVHKASKVKVPLEALGISKVEDGWNFMNNLNEEAAMITNGKRLRISLWDDFKENAFFKYDDRMKAAFPDTNWMRFMGDQVKKDRQADTKAAMDAMEVAQQACKRAGLATAVPTPVKKRRTVR